MATPPVPQDFLQLSIKYEYFKRNTAMQAHLNVCELVDRWHSEGSYKGIPKVELDPEESPEDFPVVMPKRSRQEESKSRKTPVIDGPLVNDDFLLITPIDANIYVNRNISADNGPIKDSSDRNASDRDSDDHGVFIEKPDNSDQREQCTLMKTRNLYDKFAEKELSEWESRKRASFAQVMCMQRIARTRYVHILRYISIYAGVRIVTGYRKLRIFVGRFGRSELAITYMSSKDGCLIWYGNDLKVDKTMKYQSLAALDFFYLVQDKNVEFAELEFLIEPYRKFDPPIWSFSSFYFKINKYLDNRKLKVENLWMRSFNHRGRVVNGKIILSKVFNFLNPDSLIGMTIRAWDESEVARRRNIVPIGGELLDVLYNTPQWKKMRKLDFAGPQIKILNPDSFSNFTHFVTVRVLDQNDLYSLIRAYKNVTRDRNTHVSTFHAIHDFIYWEALCLVVSRGSSRSEHHGQSIQQFHLENGVSVTIDKKMKCIVFVW